MLLFYVRHGDPIYNPDQITPLGEEQAKALANRLQVFGLDEIYASTSNRAIQTAKPTSDLLGLEIKTLDFLNENYLDKLKVPTESGKLDWVWAHPEYANVLASREVRQMGEQWYKHPKLESFHFESKLSDINEQLDKFIAGFGYEHDSEKGLYKIVERNAEKRIAIFAHECMGKIVMSHLLDIPFPYYAAHFEMHTSAFTVIRFDDGSLYEKPKEASAYARARVLTLSNDSHLYRDGVSLTHRFTHLRDEY